MSTLNLRQGHGATNVTHDVIPIHHYLAELNDDLERDIAALQLACNWEEKPQSRSDALALKVSVTPPSIEAMTNERIDGLDTSTAVGRDFLSESGGSASDVSSHPPSCPCQ
jgi:hypothetical protein